MAFERIIHEIKNIRPKRILDLRGKLSYRRIGSGACRTAYFVANCVVVKFPEDRELEMEECLAHAQKEICHIRKIKYSRKMKSLRQYVPKVYYMDYTNGVIVMERLRLLRKGRRRDTYVDMVIRKVENTPSFSSENDIGPYNVGRDKNNKLKILDFGLL